MINGKTLDADGKPKKVRRDVFNAMSEKLTSSFTKKWSFKERRCLIPMSSWDEWPETGSGKQRVRVSMPAEPVFMSAGLYGATLDPKTGARVDVYTMPPNEFLGTVRRWCFSLRNTKPGSSVAPRRCRLSESILTRTRSPSDLSSSQNHTLTNGLLSARSDLLTRH